MPTIRAQGLMNETHHSKLRNEVTTSTAENYYHRNSKASTRQKLEVVAQSREVLRAGCFWFLKHSSTTSITGLGNPPQFSLPKNGCPRSCPRWPLRGKSHGWRPCGKTSRCLRRAVRGRSGPLLELVVHLRKGELHDRIVLR